MKGYSEKTDDRKSPIAGMPAKWRISLGILLCLFAIVLAILACVYSYRSLYTGNNLFTLSRIDVVGADELLDKEIRAETEHMGIRPFESHLPGLDIKTLREKLLANSRVSDVKLRRLFPGTLQIEVSARVPVAILHFPKSARRQELLIDQEGMVLPRDARANAESLPTVIGINPKLQLVPGEQYQDKAILAFLTFLKESRLRPEGSHYEVMNVKLDDRNGRMILTLEASGVFRNGAKMVMPIDNVSQEMDRVKVVVELRQQANETISYINAEYQNIPVRP